MLRLQVQVPNAFFFYHLESNRRGDNLNIVIKILPKCLTRNVTEEGSGVWIEIQQVENVPAFLPPNFFKCVVVEIVYFLLYLDILIVALIIVVLMNLILLMPLVPGEAFVLFVSGLALFVVVLLILILFSSIVGILLDLIVLILFVIVMIVG